MSGPRCPGAGVTRPERGRHATDARLTGGGSEAPAVTANRSLDEFAGRSGGGEAGGDAADDASPAGDGEPDGSAVEPVAPTYAWSPDGGLCASCGEAAEERWRDGDDLVCPDCKAW